MQFRKIDIRRMPGFESGGFVLNELSPGINLIYGPNASGKSTTANAIQLLLWPESMKSFRPFVVGWMNVDHLDWMVELDVNTYRYQCNGNESDESPPGIPGAEVRQRYYLALHELIQDDNHLFAEQILLEATGGYDVNQAGNLLKFSHKISTPRGLITECKNARKELYTARQTQLSLREEENRLREFQEELDRAHAAKLRSEWLERAIRYQECRVKKQETLERYQAFPTGISKLIGDEIDRLNNNNQKQDTRRVNIQQSERKIEDARQQLERTQLTEKGVAEEVIIKLRHQASRLQNIQHEIDRLDREINNAQQLEMDSKNRLDSMVENVCIEQIDRSAINEFIEFSRKAEMNRANHLAQEELKRWLGEMKEPSSLKQVQRSLDILVKWLNSAEGNGRLDYRLFLFLALVAGSIITSSCMMLWLDVSLLSKPFEKLAEIGLFIVGIVLLGWVFSAHPNRRKRQDFQKEYEELDLDLLDNWSLETVIQKVKSLHSNLGELTVGQEKALRWSQLQTKIESSSKEKILLENERTELLQKYGFATKHSIQELPDAHLTHLIANIVSWQQTYDQRTSLDSEQQKALTQFTSILDTVNQELSPFVNEVVSTVEEAVAAVEGLNTRRELFQEATRNLQLANQLLEDNQLEQKILEEEYGSLFEVIEIEHGDESSLHEYCRMRDSFLEIKDELNISKHEEMQSFEMLTPHPDLREISIEDLKNELSDLQDVADHIEELNEKIGGIRRAVDDAKQKDDLEIGLLKEESILDQLRMEREKNYESSVGSLLVHEIEKVNRDCNLPAVFQHAERIFTLITQGRYRLQIDNQAKPPTFRAYDTALERGQSLEELSSGTRLQIMMAVRLAFVECQEIGIKLPLLMDECLGNSDESRAQTIIDSVLELCQQGRQVFYFTAQHDEVGKWISRLKERDLPYQTIDLAEVRNFLESERLPQFELQSPPRNRPPHPGNSTHEEYGRLLSVPEFSPWESIGSVHLWHFIYQPTVLHQLIDKGINRWGQLQNLVEQFGSKIVSDDSGIYEKAIAMGKVYESLSRCMKVGRGKPVTRETLLDSGAVSERFLDELNVLVRNVNGDAQKLIHLLEGQSVSGFRHNKCQELRDYFIEHGYLDTRPIMEADNIRAQVLSSVLNYIETNVLQQSELEKVIHRILESAL